MNSLITPAVVEAPVATMYISSIREPEEPAVKIVVYTPVAPSRLVFAVAVSATDAALTVDAYCADVDIVLP